MRRPFKPGLSLGFTVLRSTLKRPLLVNASRAKFTFLPFNASLTAFDSKRVVPVDGTANTAAVITEAFAFLAADECGGGFVGVDVQANSPATKRNDRVNFNGFMGAPFYCCG